TRPPLSTGSACCQSVRTIGWLDAVTIFCISVCAGEASSPAGQHAAVPREEAIAELARDPPDGEPAVEEQPVVVVLGHRMPSAPAGTPHNVVAVRTPDDVVAVGAPDDAVADVRGAPHDAVAAVDPHPDGVAVGPRPPDDAVPL